MRIPGAPIRRLTAPVTAGLIAFVATPQTATAQSDDSTLAAAFTHAATRLVVTPWPGYLGFPREREEVYGPGFGVWFPVDASHAVGELSQDPGLAAGNSLIASGGLVIGVAPDGDDPPIILSAQNLGGALSCPAEGTGEESDADRCLTFNDGAVSYDTHVQGRKTVRWQYSDAGSAGGAGLAVVQESVDGRAPADYVLFEYTITNTSASTVTLYAGFFLDWDVDPWNQNVGATDMGGHVTYMVSSGGPYVGTVLLGDHPVAGNHFWPNARSPDHPNGAGQFMNVLRGLSPQGASSGRTATGSEPNDFRYIHSVGPITLHAGEAGRFWMALIAGEDVTALRSNAAAAAAHVHQELPEPQPFSK